jgi:hypothetical protein
MGMGAGRRKRQVFLFVTAIVLPAAVLIGLAARIIGQERELAGKRAADDRRNAIEQLRRELAARLEAIKLQEINRLIRTPGRGWTDGPENAAVVFLAKLDGERLILPWEAAPVAGSAQFIQHRREGELQEFIKKDYRAAGEAYRRALESARHQAESAEARLLLARALAKAGSAGEAWRQYLTLLKQGGEAKDEQGVAFRLYAAERLLEAKREQDAVLSFLLQQVKAERWLTLPEMAVRFPS